MPPPALFWYHPFSKPETFTHHNFKNSMIGMGMQTFNSAVGVTPDAWHLMSTCTTICPGCRNIFLIDGFRAHTPHNHCTKPGANYTVTPSQSIMYNIMPNFLNHIVIVPCHPATNNDTPPSAFLEFHPKSNPVPPPDYFSTSMIGCPLGLELQCRHSVGCLEHCTHSKCILCGLQLYQIIQRRLSAS